MSVGDISKPLLAFHQIAFLGTLIAVIFLSNRAKRSCVSAAMPHGEVQSAGPREPLHPVDNTRFVPSTDGPNTLHELDSMFDANEISIEEYVERRRTLVFRNR
ncbi:MAG: hypothetical protein IT203_04805 [Fimbriimonadaceae bacterium]|nr:hypothetical protein [Fimbriimonadaceae bacterium]